MTNRKKPGVAFWATVVMVLLVGYPLSFGPACWLCEKQFVPTYVAWMVYRPLTWQVVENPHGTGEPIRKYAAVFSQRDNIGLPRTGIRKIKRKRPFWAGSPIDYEMDDQLRQDLISQP